jgi:hypothetical protein
VSGSQTLQARLERDRLEHRMERIERALSALQDRALYRNATLGATPQPMLHAIADFQLELARLRRRLSNLPA